MGLELHPEARVELRSAALWYDERRPGLGDQYIAEVSAAFDRIRDAPESYPAWPDTRAADALIRKATIQRFPYVIAFEKHDRHVLVLAVAHAKRRPSKAIPSGKKEWPGLPRRFVSIGRARR